MELIRQLPRICSDLCVVIWTNDIKWEEERRNTVAKVKLVDAFEQALPQLDSLRVFDIQSTSFAAQLLPVLSSVGKLQVLCLSLEKGDGANRAPLSSSSFPSLEEIELVGNLTDCTDFLESLSPITPTRIYRLVVEPTKPPSRDDALARKLSDLFNPIPSACYPF